jgi:hypothetical protein
MFKLIFFILFLFAGFLFFEGFIPEYRECRAKKLCPTLSDVDFMRVLDHAFAKERG